MNIFSVHAGRTDFLKPHVEYLRHYCTDDFTYHCVDNFAYPNQDLMDQCAELGVRYVRPEMPRQGNAWDHAPCLNSLKQYTSDDVVNVIYEFDVFCVKQFSFMYYIQGVDISGIYQQRHDFKDEYIAPFLVVVNKNSGFSTLDWTGGAPFDVGGKTREYIRSGKKVNWLSHTPGIRGDDCKIFLGDYNPNYGCQVIESKFIHYYKGTNWDGSRQDFMNQKNAWFFDLLERSKTEEIFNHDYLDRYQTIFSHAFKHWGGSQRPYASYLNPYYEN